MASRTALFTPTLSLTQTAGGDYYHASGEVQVNPALPVMPRAGLDVGETGWDAHGVLFSAGSYQDSLEFEPLVTAVYTDAGHPSAVFSATWWYPSLPGTLNVVPGARERLVVMPAQYRHPGLERVYDEMSFEVFYSTSDDWQAPLIPLVEDSYDGSNAGFG